MPPGKASRREIAYGSHEIARFAEFCLADDSNMNLSIPYDTDVAVDRLANVLQTLALALRDTADALVAASTALRSEQERQAASAQELDHQLASMHAHQPSRDLQTIQGFLPLELEARINVDTRTAAFHLNRKEQTLRGWACLENGPLRPLRISGRLAWPVTELRRICDATKRR